MKGALKVGFLLAGSWSVAHATVYCPNSPAALVADLLAAQANGSSDEVRIVAGTYLLTVEPTYSAAPTEAYAIEVSGGWNAACNLPNSGTTLLNGQGQVRALAVLQDSNSPAATLSVHDLKLIEGHTSGIGGGLYVFDRSGAVTVERNIIVDNHSDQLGGGLAISTAGPVLVRNNVLAFNTSASQGAGAFVDTNDPSSYVTGNTIFGNVAQAACGGLDVTSGSGQVTFWISNNIIWSNNNGAADLCTGMAVLLHNDIGMQYANPDPLSTGNLSVDPQFAPCMGFLCFNFRLARSSPLVDAGFDGPPAGISSFDLDRATRLVGPHVDIGAYELDRIFSNGFE